MADVAMCLAQMCEHRKRCYRYMAKPDPGWQAYAGHIRKENGEWVCHSFIDLKTRDFDTVRPYPTREAGCR